jgi:hypothetical protein
MSDLSRQDYRRILYEEMGWDDKLEELEKSEKEEGAVSGSSQAASGAGNVSPKRESEQTA